MLPFWDGFRVSDLQTSPEGIQISLEADPGRMPYCSGCAKYGREVIGRVRVDAANALSHDKPARRVVKQAHWLLLRNPDHLKDHQQVRLDEVLAANQSLMTVYVMKAQLACVCDARYGLTWVALRRDMPSTAPSTHCSRQLHAVKRLKPPWILKALWAATTAWAWRRAWQQRMSHAEQSQIPALIRFARRLRGYWRGIISRVRWPMHTGQLEGINNKIKVIKRMAYGYRDSEYFFKKIKAAFPGNP